MALDDPNAQTYVSGPSQFYADNGASTPGSWAHHSTTYIPVDSMTPLTTNPSRKRSRDESSFLAEGDNSYFPFPSVSDVTMPASIPEEPIYGEGMTYIGSSSARPLQAESQTGTWYEEQEPVPSPAAEAAIANAERQRPVMPASRKSIKLSQPSSRSQSYSNLLNGAPSSPPKSSMDRPEIDEATIALGIGWTKMSSEDPDLQAAARGWAKYIGNHYVGVNGAEIILKSRSLNAYLVRAQEGFYLFGEDLLEGRLVGRTWETCLQNLKTVPMAFEGQDVLRATETPDVSAMSQKSDIAINWSEYDQLNNQLRSVGAAAGGMEID